jgi:TrkA domain protein
MTIERTLLPGVGVSHAVTTSTQQRLGVISHLSGRRDLVVYDEEDPERAAWTLVLDEHEAHQLADLLSGTVTADHLTALERLVDGVSAVRIRIPAGSAYDGVALRETRAGSRTGASVVAVARAGGEVVPAPGPGFVLHHDDVVVAVGDEHGIAALTALIAGSASPER